MNLEALQSIRSLAYRTDLSIVAFQGRVQDRGDYIVAESPDNPAYFWGNLLFMKKPPKQGDYTVWTGRFEEEFRHQPLVKHKTFGWDSTDASEGNLNEFIKHGFEIEKSLVLTLQPHELVKPKCELVGLDVRPLETDADWEAALQNQLECRLQTFKLESYLPFKKAQMKKYRALSESPGFGHWFGAFLDGGLVGDCGLFAFQQLGRYQAVGTHPAYRRRGICANLVFKSAMYAFERLGVKKLVMVADPEYHAAKVYESVGFKVAEKAIGIYWYPKGEWNKVESG